MNGCQCVADRKRADAPGVCECARVGTTAAQVETDGRVDAVAVGAGVGGGVSGLLIIGLIVWLVKRRSPTTSTPRDDIPMRQSEYSALDLAPPYGDVPNESQLPTTRVQAAVPFAQGYQSLPKNRYGDIPVETKSNL